MLEIVLGYLGIALFLFLFFGALTGGYGYQDRQRAENEQRILREHGIER
jgi:hypothetical protein